jgi:hypothetical protein
MSSEMCIYFCQKCHLSDIFYQNDTYYGFVDGRSCKDVSPREAFGFYIISPKGHGGTYDKTYFNAVVIFTPKPGLFNETPPA